MSIVCPAQKIFNINAVGQSLQSISLADLDITGDGAIFFTNAFITLVDDADGVSIFPNVPNNQQPRPGTITNSGTTISYTTASDVQPGDVITIEYLAVDQSDNTTCEQTFEFRVGAASNIECSDESFSLTDDERFGFSLPDNIVQPVSVVINSTVNSDGTEFDNAFIGVATANSFQVSNQKSDLPQDIYSVKYVLVDGSGIETNECEFIIDWRPGAATNNPTNGTGARLGNCIDSGDVLLSNGPNNVLSVGNLTSGGVIQEITVIDNATGRQATNSGISLNANGSAINVGNVADNSSYAVSYTISGTGDFAEESTICSGFQVIKSDSTVSGINNLDCAASRFIGGAPNIQCGGAASFHDVFLQKLDGTPLTLSASQLRFALAANSPPGVVITVESTDGAGNYMLKIDPSAADCAGSIESGILF